MERSNSFAHWPNEYQEEIVQALARNDQGAEIHCYCVGNILRKLYLCLTSYRYYYKWTKSFICEGNDSLKLAHLCCYYYIASKLS